MYKLLISILFVLITFLISTSNINAGWVNGYYRRNGTYVPGYYRSSPNGLRYDNYSFKGGSLFNNSYFNSLRNYNYNWYRPSYLYQSDYWTGYNFYRWNR